MDHNLTLLVVSSADLAADAQAVLAAVAALGHSGAGQGVRWMARWWHDGDAALPGTATGSLDGLLQACDLLVLLEGHPLSPATAQAVRSAQGRPGMRTWQGRPRAARQPDAGDGTVQSDDPFADWLTDVYDDPADLVAQVQTCLNRLVDERRRLAARPAGQRARPPALAVGADVRAGGRDGGDPFTPHTSAHQPGLDGPDSLLMALGALGAVEELVALDGAAPAAAGAAPDDLSASLPGSPDAAPADPLVALDAPPAALPPTAEPGLRPVPAAAVPPVDAAVFCPPRVARASVFLVQVYLYPPPAASAVAAEAQQHDPGAQSMARVSLPLDVPAGARVALRLELPTLQVDEPDALLVWRGVPTAAQFEVAVPADLAADDAIGRVRLAVDGVPVGTMRFRLKVMAPGGTAQPAAAVADQARRYRHAFVSYASQDRAEVLRRVQAFRIAGLTVFQDVLDLDPGEHWAETLYREIDRCDVFLLFWSRAAAASAWVAREIDHALARQGGDADRPPAIQPVPIEGPPIVKPPPQLAALHFNDALLAQIAVASAPPHAADRPG